jgi:hypothetical protein
MEPDELEVVKKLVAALWRYVESDAGVEDEMTASARAALQESADKLGTS